jgi:hypothetical protein
LLHGAARNRDESFFESLPEDDPHHAQAKRVRKPRVLKRDRPLPLFEGIT